MLLLSAGRKWRKHLPLETLVEDGRGTRIRARHGRTHSSPVTGKRLLGAFAELRKATSSFFITVRPKKKKKILTPTGRIFINFYIWVFFENLSKNVLKSDKNKWYFT
jgi:hypothetical protein